MPNDVRLNPSIADCEWCDHESLSAHEEISQI
jgi:hypothetical protein